MFWAVMGALVASRRPGNQISWFYCASGLSAIGARMSAMVTGP